MRCGPRTSDPRVGTCQHAGKNPQAMELPLRRRRERLSVPKPGAEEMTLGEIGELVLRGPQVMKGYWNRSQESSEAIRNGWFYTR